MARHLLVAIWRIKSVSSAPWPIATRNRQLAAAGQDAYTLMRSAAQPMSLEVPRYLFVAPEYYYYIKGADFALYDATERDQTYQFLAGLASAHKKMALVPGTVRTWTSRSWRRVRSRPTS